MRIAFRRANGDNSIFSPIEATSAETDRKAPIPVDLILKVSRSAETLTGMVVSQLEFPYDKFITDPLSRSPIYHSPRGGIVTMTAGITVSIIITSGPCIGLEQTPSFTVSM